MPTESTPIETSEVLSLFPSFVWKTRWIASVRDPVRSQLHELLDRQNPQWQTLAENCSWQSDPDLHTLTETNDVVRRIIQAVGAVLRFLDIADHPLEMTGCWLNVNAKGSGHSIHAHPNNFLSGAYYLDTPVNAQTIYFHDPRTQAAVLRPPVTALAAANTDLVAVSVSAGTLLLFPAYLPHSVPPSGADSVRVSMSFNLMFPGLPPWFTGPGWTGGMRGPSTD